MRKLLILMMALVIALSLTACGDDNTPASQQGSSSGEESNTNIENSGKDSETEFVSMNFGYITMSVPSVFKAVEEKDGMYVSAGPDSSILVTPTMGIDLLPSEWDESLAKESLEMLYGSTYTNLEFAAFEGDVNMNGNTAVYVAFFGKNANGKDRMAQVVRLFNADLTAQYMITFIHSADDEFFTPEMAGEIINSITLSPDAQNLEPEIEG